MTDECISPLRQRMIEDMSLRHFGEKTQKDYIRAVKNLTIFLGRSPDTATAEDLRLFQLHLTENRVRAPSINFTVTALRFFFTVTLDRADTIKHLTFVAEPRKIPVVLSPEEVARFLEAAPGVKYKAAFSAAYGAGLRVSEVAALKVSDIDSERMLLRIEQGKACKAHDFAEVTWRHLNFFQHHCYITAKVPRTDCPEHGVLRISVPWAREGSRFTLLFEQAALLLVREMPVLAAARIMEITDQRLWRIVVHYVGQAVARLDLTRVTAIGLDETAAKRGHTYVTVFIDLDRTDKPVVFVTPGRGKDTVAKFKAFLATHGGSPGRIVEVVCDMSGAFIAAIGESFDNAAITVDWFHVVQLFTKALDEVRRAEARHSKLPKALRWAILKRADGRLTEAQAAA